MMIAMSNAEQWECQCRRCHGVFNAGDAVQYVWESSLGSCGVPIVVGVNVVDDGFVTCAQVYWHGEPDEPLALGEAGEFLVSFRPGEGTVPTEGDIERWVQWSKTRRPPRDWLIADGLRFRSVPDAVEALRKRTPMPDQQAIVGDWWGVDAKELTFRNKTRARWTETVRRNQRLWSV
jgi:hypothetical protein